MPPEPVMPLAAVQPRTTEEVAAAVQTAARFAVPIVQYGGGTGLMGGALSVVPAVVLDMRSMNRVLTVSVEDRTATAQAGVVLAELGAALEPHGLILGHDPWTVPIATVGGTISTNSLGYRGGKYGSMGDQVLGLEVVLADGQVLKTRAVPRSSTGPRLHHLFAGAEGQFGIITAATLRVFPVPERRELAALDLPSFEHGFRVAQEMAAIGLVPALLDFGAAPGEPGRMYLGFEGFAEEVAAHAARARRIWSEVGAEELDRATAWAWWEDRHVSAERLRGWRTTEREEPAPGERGSAVFDYLHMALPASAVLPYIRQAGAIFARHGVSIREWGLWNQPELLSTVLFRRTDTPAELAEATAAVDAALMLAQDVGGTMEYVHGAGVRYAHLMAREHGAGLDVLRAVKRALDPLAALNPGKLGL
jgi:FAD/FMN-containing dehydrogenase